MIFKKNYSILFLFNKEKCWWSFKISIISEWNFKFNPDDIISFVWPFAYFGNWDSVLDQIHILSNCPKIIFCTKKINLIFQKTIMYCCQIYQFFYTIKKSFCIRLRFHFNFFRLVFFGLEKSIFEHSAWNDHTTTTNSCRGGDILSSNKFLDFERLKYVCQLVWKCRGEILKVSLIIAAISYQVQSSVTVVLERKRNWTLIKAHQYYYHSDVSDSTQKKTDSTQPN